MENLGDAIRDQRRKRKLTLERLSEKTNLSKSFLSQVERGRAQPSISSLKKIAQEFAISVVDLFSLELGDSIYFPAHFPHSWRGVGNEPIAAIWVLTPPRF